MVDAEQGSDRRISPGSLAEPAEALPFRVELCAETERDRVERVLARAHSAQIGHAIFKAAQSEYPGRRITLRQGRRLIVDSAN